MRNVLGTNENKVLLYRKTHLRLALSQECVTTWPGFDYCCTYCTYCCTHCSYWCTYCAYWCTYCAYCCAYCAYCCINRTAAPTAAPIAPTAVRTCLLLLVRTVLCICTSLYGTYR